ncbi:hypothetical protein [Cellulomonas xiejunii]|uniref:hypothetical protein n=1 Tax=Cellulomonas xiejunii TaxID=2968083 RepID=UPI001D0DE7E3|nr:hypothetical protein [Cellulomonas xiejunii]MCC2315235.1 hypothetical protein [Cellulomonas xiejunii]
MAGLVNGTPGTSSSTTTPTDTADTGWWRRNRWGLVALPVALALALGASGDRVRTLWWDHDLRRPVGAAPGKTVAYHDDLLDGVGGTYRVDVQVRLDGVEDATELPRHMQLPSGARAVRVDLTLSADPGTVLVGCRLAVRDAEGTRYDHVPSAWGAAQPTVPCTPEGATGPWPSVGDGSLPSPDAGQPPRPATWSVSPVVVVPRDVEIADVVLWWQLPRYVRLDVAS